MSDRLCLGDFNMLWNRRMSDYSDIDFIGVHEEIMPTLTIRCCNLSMAAIFEAPPYTVMQ